MCLRRSAFRYRYWQIRCRELRDRAKTTFKHLQCHGRGSLHYQSLAIPGSKERANVRSALHMLVGPRNPPPTTNCFSAGRKPARVKRRLLSTLRAEQNARKVAQLANCTRPDSVVCGPAVMAGTSSKDNPLAAAPTRAFTGTRVQTRLKSEYGYRGPPRRRRGGQPRPLLFPPTQFPSPRPSWPFWCVSRCSTGTEW
jgi:hypothetical protein